MRFFMRCREIFLIKIKTNKMAVREASRNLQNLDTHLKEVSKIFFGFEEVHEFQREAVKAFLERKHVIVNTPTGHGKSFCFHVLPYLVDSLSSRPYGVSVLLVVSPLIALMKDQVNSLTAKGLKAVHLTEQSDYDKIIDTTDGCIIPTFVFVSPESLAQKKLRNLITSEEFRINCVGVAIDEAHCITNW